ncbi:EAL and HDOD domain-containing protein [Ornithinibacillus xuwenensis]|uniref:HDOD domain-containing protein n=1 Tax=Ornithinibacillus xuwenensis TaxID=3144668 RepID=A0ABU9XKR0_9BACI
MEVFVARQPILTKKQEVFAYELLYRNNKQDNKFSHTDIDQATSEVINSFLQIGIEELSEGKPCFINFTEKILANSIPTFIQPESMVIEILEGVNPTDKVIENCSLLKAQGYKIALDDFEMKVGNPNFHLLLELADIIKIDIQKTARDEQIRIMRELKKYDLIYLAEKVETREEFKQCLQDGYTYFQGYFFSKPVILSTNDYPVQNHSVFVVISELTKREPDIEKIAKIIEADVSLSYKLLRLLNSPSIGLVYKIKSIKQAIVLLGLIELRKWFYVLSIRETLASSGDAPDEIIKLCLTRAKANEMISQHIGRDEDSSSFFLTGLLSLVETIFKQPLENILKKLPLDREIKDTLRGKDTSLNPVLKLVYAAERADWKSIDSHTKEIGIDQKVFFDLHHASRKWAKDVLDGSDLF